MLTSVWCRIVKKGFESRSTMFELRYSRFGKFWFRPSELNQIFALELNKTKRQSSETKLCRCVCEGALIFYKFWLHQLHWIVQSLLVCRWLTLVQKRASQATFCILAFWLAVVIMNRVWRSAVLTPADVTLREVGIQRLHLLINMKGNPKAEELEAHGSFMLWNGQA